MKPIVRARILNKAVFRALSVSLMLAASAGSLVSIAAEPTIKLKAKQEETFKRPACAAADMKNFMCYNPQMKAATQLQQSEPVQKAFEATVGRAQKHLDSLKPSADKLVIFDLDDTLIDDIPYYAQPEPRDFSGWLHQRPVKYHESVLKLLKTAKARGFSVIYITGRRANYTLPTAEQVQELHWDASYTRPLGLPLSSEAHKKALRQMLRGIGYTIVLNIGDQVTDHDLPIDESKGEFLLPNVMYTVY